MDSILNGLDTRPGSKERAIVMLGQRGYGKTVMLWEICERARERGFVVANPVSVRDGFMSRIVEKLREAGSSVFGQGQSRITGGGIGALGFSASLDFSHENTEVSYEQRLATLCRELTKRNLGTLILVDELQANNSDIRSLVGTYQELVGEQLDVAMVLAGLPACVSSTLNDRVLTFLNRARKLTLAPLATGDIDAFFRRAFRASGVEIEAGLRREAAQHSKGSPYLMQLIGHYIVSYASNAW